MILHHAAARDHDDEAGLGDEAVPRRRRGGLRREGNEVGPGGGGYLVLRRPWPAMLRGIYSDHERYVETYWSRFPGVYFAGDGARIDEDGDFWLLGRVDDVMNVSGHRISTIEVESALVDHHAVAEAAVCGRNDALTGQAIVAFVTLKGGEEGSVEMLEELRDHVAKKIGPIAKPANIVFTPELPKTRSREDHAPAAARRRREPPARRHDDARRPDGGRGDPRPGHSAPRRVAAQPAAAKTCHSSGTPFS